MSQNVNLSLSGIYTSINDYQGLPQGALDGADNIEIRYKNVGEPRRGFDYLPDSAMAAVHFIKNTNFYVGGVDLVIGLTSDGDLRYYTGVNPWPMIPGNVSSNITPPNSLNGKSKFIKAGQNLYVTAQDGVRSLSSGTSAMMLRAGVPKGLNLAAATNTDQSGFFTNNVVLSTTGKITSSTAVINNLSDITGIAIDQYVTGTDVDARLVVQDLTYTSALFGVAGNSTTIAYTTGGTAGAEVVTVVGSAISVKIQSGVSTATQVRAAVNLSAPALLLVSCAITGTAGTAQTAPTGPTPLAGGLDNTIPVGTKVLSITDEAPIIIETGNTTAGSATILGCTSLVGIVAGVLVSGTGIPEGAKVVSTSTGPNTIVLDVAAYQTATGTTLTFTSALVVTMDQNALATLTGTPITFYSGSQVGYRMVFGRVETDINGTTITRLGSPSSLALATNISPYTTNTTVVGTIPKNSSQDLTFVQLYRSLPTDSATITPLDQYNLVYERQLVAGDFTARTITITDDVPDSLVGIPLYTGSDQEGALQANNPPPMCWDMCKFRDFTLFGNITRPTTTQVTIVSVGSPSGIQAGDTLTITGTFSGVSFSETYTAAASEDASIRQFKIFSSGTASQNIADTADSLIRVLNYDNALPVHVILLSTATDLPGQLLIEADYPNLDTFTIDATGHPAAYDPTLTTVVSDLNTINNGISVSKSGELEAVPLTNLLYAGDSSSALYRMIPLRDYVIVLKSDGIYKVQGFTPSGLVINPFDLTTKIIGAETAVSLNSGVWMLSNQGVVSISDGGVDAKSVPIDDQLNAILGTYKSVVEDVGFAIGYESDRKYILAIPQSDNTFADIEYNFNYVTSAWTTWSRNLYGAFVHSNEDKLYISKAASTQDGISKERKTGTYRDFVDEGFDVTIVSVTDDQVVLADITDVEIGDVLYQDETHFSPITDINVVTNAITIQYALSFVAGDAAVLKSYLSTITWKQVFGDNPAFVRQFSEGIALFKNTHFNTAAIRFITDFSTNIEDVPLVGVGNALWGLFPWGRVPWGGTIYPQKIRFYIPQAKQLASYLLPELRIKQGYSDFRCQGLVILYESVSPEVGIT